MAETKGSRTLEMRVAELEDKLAQMHISEEELETYQKVAQKLGASALCHSCSTSPCVAAQAQQPCVAAQQPPCVAAQAAAQQPCVAAQQPCVASQQASLPIFYRCYYYPIYRPIFYQDCIGPCAPGGAASGGGGFGGFGT
jgi:hypothetical protein